VSRTVLHLDTGSLMRGGQRQVLLLMRALRERGWRNVLATPPRSALSIRAKKEGFERVPFSPRGDLDLLAAFRLGLAAAEVGIPLWYAHTARAHGVARLALSWPRRDSRRRLLVTRRTAFARRGGPFHGIKYRDRHIDAYIAISEAVAAGLSEFGVATRRIRLVPDAVEPEPFQAAARFHLGDEVTPPDRFDPALRDALRESLGAPASAYLVGAAGALDSSKGFDLLIQAASEATVEEPRLHFAVAGEGPQREALELQIKRLGLTEHFLLLGRRKDLPDLMAAFDLFCMPSREEGLGSAVLEAFAAGLPVLASDAGGLAELLQPGITGSRFPQGDAAALAERLVQAVRKHEEGLEMARVARRRVLVEFGTGRMAEAVERVYHSLGMGAGQSRAKARAGGTE